MQQMEIKGVCTTISLAGNSNKQLILLYFIFILFLALGWHRELAVALVESLDFEEACSVTDARAINRQRINE
ncbi:MAG TPA: hypothetical protein DIT42_09785 [Gammaproteobacteria bacterium]|nr:hypothetical protein [Gammaproteobacteria bacterium]